MQSIPPAKQKTSRKMTFFPAGPRPKLARGKLQKQGLPSPVAGTRLSTLFESRNTAGGSEAKLSLVAGRSHE
jgi:hypothetical protein